MNITTTFTNTAEKESVVASLMSDIVAAGYTVTSHDATKPWGAFFVIDEKQVEQFAAEFFRPLQDTVLQQLETGLPLTPKFLLVAPEQRLSWQYHHRRGEIWRVITRPVGVTTSNTDALPSIEQVKQAGETIAIAQGERHRLIGLTSWGLVAEIWLHTDMNNPSNEEDIVRLADDYRRE